MQWHLDEISSQVASGAHAVLILDRAGWHTTGKLEVPANITLLPLPPRAPELNPVENIWQFMRDNWLSNRIFKSYDDIVAICCQAWNKLIDQPWKIMSIGLRKWAPWVLINARWYKKGPLGGCGLVPVVHGRAPRATRRALNRLTRRRAREGPVGPRGQAWAGWSVQLAVGV